MADTPTGETVTPEAPSNEPSTVAAPVVDNSNVDVEAAKKEAEQARMRANQLENELKKIREQQEAERQKQLEEQGKWKEVADAKTAELERIQRERDEQQRQAELENATNGVFKDYPANVVDIAKTTGLSLPDDSEEAIAAFKEKLDTIKKQVVPTASPSANNPHNPAPAEASKAELLDRMKAGDKTAVNQYISELPAIKRMREIAQNGA